MNKVVQQQSPIAPPPWYRQFWPWLLISIPLLTVIAGVATIWIASREPVALVHDDYYKEGLAINQNLARDRAAANANMMWLRSLAKIRIHKSKQTLFPEPPIDKKAS